MGSFSFITLTLFLDFSLILISNEEENQIFFTHEGETGEIILYRRRDAVFLKYKTPLTSSWYQLTVTDPIIRFEWPYFVNGEQMKLVNGSSETVDLVIGNRTFNDSITTNHPDLLISQCSRTDYNYITGAILGMFVLMQSPDLIRRLVEKVHSRTDSFLQVTSV